MAGQGLRRSTGLLDHGAFAVKRQDLLGTGGGNVARSAYHCPPARITGRKSIDPTLRDIYPTETTFAQCRRYILSTIFAGCAVSPRLARISPIPHCRTARAEVQIGGMRLCQPGKELAHAPGSFIDVLHGHRDKRCGCVPRFRMPRRGRRRHAPRAAAWLPVQSRCEYRPYPDKRRCSDDVECSLRLGAGDAGNLKQLGQHVVAQLDELGAELADALLRASQGGDSGLLHKACRVGCGLRLELAQVGHYRASRPAQTPPASRSWHRSSRATRG